MQFLLQKPTSKLLENLKSVHFKYGVPTKEILTRQSEASGYRNLLVCLSCIRVGTYDEVV